MIVDLIIVVAFLLVNLYIGILSSKKNLTLDHFSVAHRSFKTFVIFATLSATFIGGGYTIGNAAKVYQIGMIYAFALLGFSLKEILVGAFIAPRMDAHRDCLSIGDIMAKKYGTSAKIFTGILSLVICGGILGAQVGAMGAIFERFFHIPSLWGILIGFSVLIFYSSVGGMRAVVYTDVLQFTILIIGIPLTFFIGIYHVGGWDKLFETTSVSHINMFTTSRDWVLFISLFITFLLGETLVPPYVQRLFMTKHAGHTRNATIMSGVMSIPFFIIVGAIGLVAFRLNDQLDPNLALPFVVQTQLPMVIRGFVIAGILSVIMSSAAGFLNAAAVAFVNDIVRPLRSHDHAEENLLKLAKISTLIVGVTAVIFALTIKNVLDILLYSYNFWSPMIIVPLVAVIFNCNVTTRNFIVGATCGVIAVVIWLPILHEPFQISSVFVGVLANLVGFLLSKVVLTK